MEKFTTFEKAMAYLDCGNHYIDAIWNNDKINNAYIKKDALARHFVWTCNKITELDYSKITDDEFNAISDAYYAFRAHYRELVKD